MGLTASSGENLLSPYTHLQLISGAGQGFPVNSSFHVRRVAGGLPGAPLETQAVLTWTADRTQISWKSQGHNSRLMPKSQPRKGTACTPLKKTWAPGKLPLRCPGMVAFQTFCFRYWTRHKRVVETQDPPWLFPHQPSFRHLSATVPSPNGRQPRTTVSPLMIEILHDSIYNMY